METDIQEVDNLDYEIINGRKVLKKHVATIHCANNLSLLERKISNALLYNAFKELKTKTVHEITIGQLKQLLGLTTRNHAALKTALKKLISTIIEWNLLEDNVPELNELEGWNASTILSSVSVKKGVITYQYSELLKSLIVDPKVYGKVNLSIQSRFKSTYALALYETCARYRGLPYTKKIDFQVFRQLMGVSDDKYKKFRDFNKRVLGKAVHEINTYSDIRITPQIVRRGRAVSALQFKLEERNIKNRIGVSTSSPVKVQPISVINSKEKGIESLEDLYGKEKVNLAIEYVKSQKSFQEGKVKNFTGYVKNALESGYIDEHPSNSQEIESLDSQNMDKIKREYCDYVNKYITSNFDKQTVDKRREYLLDFFNQKGLRPAAMFLKNKYLVNGKVSLSLIDDIENKSGDYAFLFESAGLSTFLYNTYIELKENVMSLDKYVGMQS